MRFSTGAILWLMVPTTKSTSAWRGEERGRPGPQRAGAPREEPAGLAGREARQAGAESIDVIVRAGGGHVLHAAARGHERVLEDGVLPGPADGLAQLRGEEVAYSHSSPRFFQM